MKNDSSSAFSAIGQLSGSFQSNSNAKYNGLIHQSRYKKIKNALSALFTYLYAVSPSFVLLHFIVTIIRLLQFIGPGLCAPFVSFWSKDDRSYYTISIISVFFHLIPPDYREGSANYFLIIYSTLTFLIVIVIIAAAYIYKKTADLPTFVSSFIMFYISSFGYLLYPIAFEFSMGMVGRCIFYQNKVDLTSSIAIIIITMLISIVYFWIYINIASRTMFFQHDSLSTVTTNPKNMIFVASILVNGITGFAAQSKNLQSYFLFISSIMYLLSIGIIFYYGGILNTNQSAAWFASCVTGFVSCILVALTIMLNKKGSFLFLIIILIISILSFICGKLFLRRKYVNYLFILDAISDSTESFNNIRSPNHFVNIAITGMKYAHPSCLNFSIFQIATEKWKNESIIWFIFAKFIAIYPEETQKLAWIFQSVIKLKLHGPAAKTIKEQTLHIVRQRESNLSNDLKVKINNCAKHVSSTKHKLRHVWDLAIQGNIAEMEGSTRRVIKEIKTNDAEYLHIFQQFPNNRFVTRNYARFCKEVKADQATAADMLDKTRILQRGIMVNEDQAHELGLSSFPELPIRVRSSQDSGALLTTESVTGMLSNDMEVEDEVQNDCDQTYFLSKRIDSVIVPAVRYSIIINLVLFMLIFALPVIASLIYVPMFINRIINPLNFMYTFGYLRTHVQQITAFGMTLIYSKLKIIPTPMPTTKRNLTYLGGTWDTSSQLSFIIKECSMLTQTIGEFYKYKSTNPKIMEAQSIAFASSINYSFYESTTVFKSQMMTLQASISDMFHQMSIIVDNESRITADILKNGITLNMLNAMAPLGFTFNKVLTLLTEFITDSNSSFQKTSKKVMIGIIIFIIIVFSISLLIQIKWLESSKTETYKCLISLPKNAVSSLAENLRVLKKENEDSSTSNSELNKQEDNIMKIFMNGGNDSSSNYRDRVVLAVLSFLVIVLHIACTVSVIRLMSFISTNNARSSPHLNYLQGAYSLKLGQFQMLQFLTINNDTTTHSYAPPLLTELAMRKMYLYRMNNSTKFYHMARFGGPRLSEVPYFGFNAALRRSYELVGCDNEFDVPDNFLNAVKCYNADNAYILMEAAMRSRVAPYRFFYTKLDPKEEIYRTLWGLLIFPIWDTFFAPMISEIVPTIQKDLLKKKDEVYPNVIIMLVVALIIDIISVIKIRSIDEHIRDVLRLLLHAPTEVVMAAPKIVSILSGDFSKHGNDTTMRDTEFYEAVVDGLPDSIIIANSEMIIESVNKSSSRIYSINDNEIVGQKLQDFFNATRFNSQINDLFSSNEKTIDEVTFIKQDGTETNLNVSIAMINQKYVVTTRDVTQTVRYNNLIQEEKTKSDQLLASILPASLVPRVQDGEMNISFSVQSATITFIDIVSFTPWCGSLPAEKVMSTLNLMFKKFDSLVYKYSTMTKIKCIGDCYMATGGIFATVNQPSEHAKEVVRFGLDALDAISEVNNELNEKLQIRVGVNTGGPIVAGVLGTEKPTFEIIGPAINMAQQMEHHGVPSNVHISRSVYELIYGDAFDIKERGCVEVKGGSNVVTYIVKRK